MRWFPFILVLVLFGCTDGLKREPAPKDLIPKEKITVLIKDIVKHEAHIQQKYQRVDRYFKTMSNTGDSIIRAHGYSTEQYERSLDHYSTHQDEMQEIYNNALNLLNEELGEIQSR